MAADSSEKDGLTESYVVATGMVNTIVIAPDGYLITCVGSHTDPRERQNEDAPYPIIVKHDEKVKKYMRNDFL
ncbi:hypothetical protein [uncultured Duncaniella sp.]|uniref:hypothetical protein n=1 Tax=uncultured Duncaniella sp. TaxID=2768039 RepID=UPI0025A5384D|nr:hypothetical protein [uncultured Duncaniella sp.]